MNVQGMWWETDEGEAHGDVVRLVDDLRRRDQNRLRMARVHQDIYEGRYLFSDENGQALRFIGDRGIEQGQLNFTRSAVDFLHAKITAQRPAIKCASRGGDWSHHIRAKKLSRFIEGQADAVGLDEKASKAMHMALRVGTAVVKTSAVRGRVHVDVVPVDELYVDPAEARYAAPQHMYQIRPVPRAELLASFPDDDVARSAVGAAPHAESSLDRRIPDDVDMVDVYEAWSLPDEEGEGGRHVVCVVGSTLVDEGWAHPRFPFAVARDSEPGAGRGFWGQGAVERLMPPQWEIDRLVSRIRTALEVGSQLRVFVDRASHVSVDHLADPGIGTVIEYDGGVPPQFSAPNPVSPELVSHLQFMIQQLYSLAGMSQDAASSMKPAGLNSGVALSYYHDFQTQRHIDVAKRYARFCLDIAELLIDRAKDLSTEDEDWVSYYSKGSVVSQISWSDVDMDRDQFLLQLEAVSPVPDSYAGRLQQISDYVQSGKVPDAVAFALIEDPDTVWMNRVLTADENYITWSIDLLMEPDDPAPRVRDEQNLQLTVYLVKAALLDAIPQGAPQEVLDRFEAYLQDCVDRMAALAPPAPPTGPPGPPGPPGAPPMGPPPGQ